MDSLIVLAVVFSAVSIFFLVLFKLVLAQPTKYRSRLEFYDRSRTPVAVTRHQPATILRQRDFSKVGMIQSILSASSFADKIAMSLAEAGLPLRVGEFLAIRFGLALAFTLPVPIAGLPIFVAIPLAIFGYILPGVYVGRRQEQRLTKFNDLLVDALSMMANALKSGSSFLQAFDLVSRELSPPLSEEFARVVTEVSIGTPIEEALQSLSRRVKSYDLFLAVTAMLVQRETGGNLAEILDSISYTIRERVRILRQVSVLTAQERMSSYLVGSLPLTALVAFSVMSPGYINPFLASPVGKILLGMAFLLEVIGFVVMGKVAKIEV